MSNIFGDPRAQRAIADALADERRAGADARRAQTELERERQRQEVAADKVLLADERRDKKQRQADERRQRRAFQRAERRRKRRERFRAGVAGLASWITTHVIFLVAGVALGGPILIAWRGQLEFGADKMHLGVLAPALPITLEGSAWFLAWLIHRAIEQQLPTGRFRLAMWVLAGIAAGMNYWHGSEKYAEAGSADGQQVGIALALASLLGIGLWELLATFLRRRRDGRTAAELWTLLWRRVRYPGLSWAAASIKAARGPQCGIEEAWEAAWIDRYGVGPDATRERRRLGRVVIRRRYKMDRRAIRAGRLTVVDGMILPAHQYIEEAQTALSAGQAAVIETQRTALELSLRNIAGLTDAVQGEHPAINRVKADVARCLSRMSMHRANYTAAINGSNDGARPSEEDVARPRDPDPSTTLSPPENDTTTGGDTEKRGDTETGGDKPRRRHRRTRRQSGRATSQRRKPSKPRPGDNDDESLEDEHRALAILQRTPDITGKDLATELGVHTRKGQRLIKKLGRPVHEALVSPTTSRHGGRHRDGDTPDEELSPERRDDNDTGDSDKEAA